MQPYKDARASQLYRSSWQRDVSEGREVMGAKIHRPNDADGSYQASNRRLSARLSPLPAETLSLIAMICDRLIANPFSLPSERHGFFRLGILRHGFSLPPSLCLVQELAAR